MRRERPKRRRKCKRPEAGTRVTGPVLVTVWTMATVPSVATAVFLWRALVLRRHVHFPAIVLIACPLFAVVAVLMTYEWWRAGRRGP